MARSWIADFEFQPGALLVRKTGIRVPLDGATIQEFLSWMRYFFSLGGAKLRPAPAPFTVAFYPDRARPWYLLWPVIIAAGGRVIHDVASADLVVHFDDSVVSESVAPAVKPGALLWNAAAKDVSKTKVGQAFEAAFGYPLALDPQRHHGPAVEKSEGNGVHDGRLVHCPTPPRAGMVYQRPVENRAGDGLMEDLRCPTLSGRPLLVFVKRRRREERFTNHNSACLLRAPEELFSENEFAAIARFCALMGLDWGGLDILRDAEDGRLYIVDANKTDMGPPIALPLREKLAATRLLAQGLVAFMKHPARGAQCRTESLRS